VPLPARSVYLKALYAVPTDADLLTRSPWFVFGGLAIPGPSWETFVSLRCQPARSDSL
jgi:hypothetical protein